MTNSDPVAWIDFADNGNIRLWTSEKRRADAEMALGRKMTPVYTTPPADAGMREALDALEAEFKSDAIYSPIFPGQKMTRTQKKRDRANLVMNAVFVLRQALTAPGATTKSDGGQPIHAIKMPEYHYQELDMSGDHHGVTSNYSEYTTVTVRGSTSDPSSTRSDQPDDRKRDELRYGLREEDLP